MQNSCKSLTVLLNSEIKGSIYICFIFYFIVAFFKRYLKKNIKF